MTISDRIYQLITEKKMSPNALAEALDLAPTSVYRWFNKKTNTSPSLDNLIKILEILDITPIEFIQGFDFPELSQSQTQLLKDWYVLDNEEKQIILRLIKKFQDLKERK